MGYPWDILVISLGYLGDIFGKSWGYLWGYLGDNLVMSWWYLLDILVISWVYLGDIFGISWLYPWGYLCDSVCLACPQLRKLPLHSLSVSLPQPPCQIFQLIIYSTLHCRPVHCIYFSDAFHWQMQWNVHPVHCEVAVQCSVYWNVGAAIRWKGWMARADKENILIANKEFTHPVRI